MLVVAIGIKTTSIRISEKLWREAKILAVKEGITLSALLEELLSAAVEGAKIAESKCRRPAYDKALEALGAKRARGEDPFRIVHEKTAVELVISDREQAEVASSLGIAHFLV